MAVKVKHKHYNNSWGGVLVQAAITEYHRLGGLKSGNLFLPVQEVGMSKVKGPADPVSVEKPLPGLQTVFVLLCPHIMESRKQSSLPCLFLEGP